MDAKERRAENNRHKAAIAQSIPSPPVAAPGTPGGASPLAWFTQATIILALLPFVGYWCAFAFENGFCSYFDIPNYFISLNSTLILATSRVFPFLGFMLWLLISGVFVFVFIMRTSNFIPSNWSKKIESNTIPKYVRYLTLFSPLLFILFIIRDMLVRVKRYPEVISMRSLVIVGSLILLIIVSFFISKYYRKSFLWNSALTLIVTYFFLLGLNKGFDFFYIQGEEGAEKQDHFPVLREQSSNYEVAVIRNYGDYLYAVHFYRDTKQFERKLFILKMSEMSKTPLTMEKVGPLKPKPIEPKPQL